MKKIVRFLTYTFLLSLFSASGFAQDITGIWRGYFITNSGDQYKYEVQLNQTKNKGLSGVTYSYLDTRFYGKATFTGNYTKATNAALVQEIKTVELKMSGSSVACIMKCRLTYTRSGSEEFLEGAYASSYEKSDPMYAIKKGGDCGGGMVYLRRVATSDFYVEPFLKTKKLTPPPVQESTVKVITPKTTPKKTVTTKPVSSPKTTETATKKPEINKPIEVEKKEPVTTVVVNKPVERKTVTPPAITRDRKNDLIKTITVSSNEIEINLYDNGEIDDDSISVYLDGNIVLANKRLSNKPIVYKLKMDDENADHTLTMVAENMGRIPPNTSLMIIQDGDKRYQVSITSTEQKNAMVRFRYEK